MASSTMQYFFENLIRKLFRDNDINFSGEKDTRERGREREREEEDA